MLNEYRLKFFNSFLYRLFDLNRGVFLNSTDREEDLEEFNYKNIKEGRVVALARYSDNTLAFAEAVKLNVIKDEKIYLNNGLCFDKNGELINREMII